MAATRRRKEHVRFLKKMPLTSSMVFRSNSANDNRNDFVVDTVIFYEILRILTSLKIDNCFFIL